jgi:two-component system, OmpR family, KDP operon response regulator KdpE
LTPSLTRQSTGRSPQRGYQVSTALTGTDTLALAVDAPPDLILLDLGLPDIDGLEVIDDLQRRRSPPPIVVVSGQTDTRDKVSALDRGAVDYVTKPFDMNERIARLRAAARRGHIQAAAAKTIKVGPSSVDLVTRTVRRADAHVHLTPTEWQMLEVLVRRPGALTTASERLAQARPLDWIAGAIRTRPATREAGPSACRAPRRNTGRRRARLPGSIAG